MDKPLSEKPTSPADSPRAATPSSILPAPPNYGLDQKVRVRWNGQPLAGTKPGDLNWAQPPDLAYHRYEAGVWKEETWHDETSIARLREMGLEVEELTPDPPTPKRFGGTLIP